MDEYRDLGMCEYLDRLAAQEDRGHTVAAVRGHDDKVAGFRRRGIDDRLVGMLMLEMDQLAQDACCDRGMAEEIAALEEPYVPHGVVRFVWYRFSVLISG
jgi:hypothetical protein